MINSDYVVYNPKDRVIAELPVIYGFNNGGSPGWYSGILLAEDGVFLGNHICSDEGFMYGDLGIVDGYSGCRTVPMSPLSRTRNSYGYHNDVV